ncbi:hypothetical protein JW859_06240 [bacterium]|nr:hypothetical protein [bacterium]
MADSYWPRRLSAFLILLFLGLLPQLAAAQSRDLNDIGNWYTTEARWRNTRGLSTGAGLVAPLTAHYNMAFGATILGLNVRTGAQYYAAVASYQDGWMDVLDWIGPLDAPVQWQSGPYHIAAGQADGRLVLWPTVPGAYPEAVQLSNSYVAHSPFAIACQPTQPVAARWTDWVVTAAFHEERTSSELVVNRYDGAGRLLVSLPPIRLSGSLKSITYANIAGNNAIYPWLGLVTTNGVRSTWYDRDGGWHSDWLADSALSSARLSMLWSTNPLSVQALYQDDSDPIPVPRLHQIDLDLSSGGISARWGESRGLIGEMEVINHAFIPSSLSDLPLLAAASDREIRLFYFGPAPQARSTRPQYDVTLYSSELLIAADQEVAAQPVLGMAGAAHWNTGYPEVFWIQLDNGASTIGELYCAAFQPDRRQLMK